MKKERKEKTLISLTVSIQNEILTFMYPIKISEFLKSKTHKVAALRKVFKSFNVFMAYYRNHVSKSKLKNIESAFDCFTFESKSQLVKLKFDLMDYLEDAKIDFNFEVQSTLKNEALINRLIGSIYQFKGKINNALLYFKKASLISEKLLTNKMECVIDYNNIGYIYFKRCEYYQSTDYFEKSLNLVQDSNDIVNTAITYNSYGKLLLLKGDVEGAEQYFSEALQQAIKLGPNHIEVANIYHNQGELNIETRNHNESISLLDKAVKIKEDYFGECNSSTAYSYASLGMPTYGFGIKKTH